jgi:hypothetical protein
MVLGLSSFALAARLTAGRAPDPAVNLNGRLLRGTYAGEILESTDNGGNWRRAAYFGAGRPVLDLALRGGQVQARIGVDGHSFALTSADGRLWYTPGSAPSSTASSAAGRA